MYIWFELANWPPVLWFRLRHWSDASELAASAAELAAPFLGLSYGWQLPRRGSRRARRASASSRRSCLVAARRWAARIAAWTGLRRHIHIDSGLVRLVEKPVGFGWFNSVLWERISWNKLKPAETWPAEQDQRQRMHIRLADGHGKALQGQNVHQNHKHTEE
jgi:hypothetical protein